MIIVADTSDGASMRLNFPDVAGPHNVLEFLFEFIVQSPFVFEPRNVKLIAERISQKPFLQACNVNVSALDEKDAVIAVTDAAAGRPVEPPEFYHHGLAEAIAGKCCRRNAGLRALPGAGAMLPSSPPSTEDKIDMTPSVSS